MRKLLAILKDAQTPEDRARQNASADGLRCIEAGPDHEVWSDGNLTITGIETLVTVYGEAGRKR